MKIFSGVLIICFIAVSALADTYIEYTLDGDWIYEEGSTGTLSLSDNSPNGITATINVPSGIDGGGLSGSRHELPVFSIDNTFIELKYSSLTSTITGTTADLSLVSELEFFDSNSNRYSLSMEIKQSNESRYFETCFTEEPNPDNCEEELIPEGLSINEGALGFNFHGNYVSAYFKDAENNLLYPFLNWDISNIVGANDFSVDNDFEAGTEGGGTVLASVNLERVWLRDGFADVAAGYWAEQFIYTIYNEGITSGCSQEPLMYCPGDTVTRAQMSVFLERGIQGSSFTPPPATGIFDDCPVGYWAANWIEQFYADGITGGCSTNPPLYCPGDNVTRAQMAVFLLRSMYGSSYTPPPATGIFSDVPVNYWAADWIEQLYAEGITGGCSSNPPQYCPGDAVNRAQMAVFIVRAFDL